MFESMKPHLAELRQRLAISVLAVFIGFIIAFTFHNTILGWITKPLNDALIQVGKIVEKREMGTWKISKQASITQTKSNETNSSIVLKTTIKSANNLHKSLSSASNIAKEPQLQRALKEASMSAKELSNSIKQLQQTLIKEENLTKNIQEDSLRKKSFNGMITTHQVGGAFFVALKVSFFTAILLALPIILWQRWLFIAPGLYDNEKKMVLPFVIGGSVMFLVGILFAYYVVTPFGFQFLITFGSFLYTPLINIEDYVGFFTKILVGFGIAFELPVFAYFLALLGLITDKTLKDYFKYAIVIIFLLAAFLTPPDVLTQLLMAFPLILLYGVSILIVAYVNPYKDDEEEENKDNFDEDEFEKAERQMQELEDNFKEDK